MSWPAGSGPRASPSTSVARGSNATPRLTPWRSWWPDSSRQSSSVRAYVQVSANATCTFPVGERVKAFLGGTFQHVGSRFTQPGDQKSNPRTFVTGLPFGGAPGTASTTVDLKLPAYQLVGPRAGLTFDDGLEVSIYVTNVLDENARLSFDRVRGGRARLAFTTNSHALSASLLARASD